MNVVFVSHCDFSGNSAMHVFSIANALSDRGVSCAVAVPNSRDTVHAHGVPRFLVLDYEEARRNEIIFSDNRGPDLVHAWTPRELVRKLALSIVERYGCPYLVHLEDNESEIVASELAPFPYESFVRLPAGIQDQLIASHRTHPTRSPEFMASAAGVTALMDRLLEFKPPHVPGLVFWPGFDPEFLSPSEDGRQLRKQLGIGTDDKVLVYTGNVHASNCGEVESLINAVALLHRRGVPVKLLKTGWNYASKDRIEEASRSGYLIDLKFVPRNRVSALLSASDVLVQPGASNAFNDYRFPSKLPEFLASGKPVILPRTNLGRYLQDGINCILLDHGHAVEIAQKVETLLADRDLQQRIGENGKAFAVSHLSWSKNVAGVHEFYEQVLSRTDSVCLSCQPHARDAVAVPEYRLPIKAIAFYLPQFHRIPENDAWWGKGFTEWTNVARGRPMFPGHHQPQLPGDLGFYDLRVPEVLQEQAQIAAEYGVSGFCFYYYWFNGKKLLETPLEQLLASGQPNFPFCICWANENWTRAWDGAENQVLIEQQYSEKSDEDLIRELIPAFRDPRYIRVADAPLFLVYRVDALPEPAETARRWRRICGAEGIPRIHLAAVQSFGITDPRPYGFDSAVEFPPHMKRHLVPTHVMPDVAPDFAGYLEDYTACVEDQISAELPDYPRFRGVMPSWDNTARRLTRAHIMIRTSPPVYESVLRHLALQTLQLSIIQEPLLFINAWNEWAEGTHLEPDQRHGRAYLEATRRALAQSTAEYYRNQGLNIDGGAIEAAISDGCLRSSNTMTSHADIQAPRGARKTQTWFTDADLKRVASRYKDRDYPALSYATVRDYCDSFDHVKPIATANGDLKDVQRPWTFKAILGNIPRGGRLLEIGAGEPWIADLLNRLGYEVWIVDPYDGSGNGPQEFTRYSAECPNLSFIRDRFSDRLQLPPASFDCIYSISVLEHVPPDGLRDVVRGMQEFLRPGGVSIHAVDHVHRGNGAAEHLQHLRRLASLVGLNVEELAAMLSRMETDTETYYLSAESHNRWRGNTPYDEFPMRTCVSVHMITPKERFRTT